MKRYMPVPPLAILLLVCVFSIPLPVFTREQDIGLMLRDDGENIPIAVRPLAESSSPLRIYKNGAIYGVELVDTDHPLATNARIRPYSSSEIKALKKFEPLRGRFECQYGPPKFGWTWIATITCQDSSGGNHLVNSGAYSTALALMVWDTAYNDINGGNRTAPIQLPPRSQFEALRRYTGGTGGGFRWNDNGTPDLNTLNATCKILGYESYVSSTCLDNQRSGVYPNGKCNFHTPSNNYVCYFIPEN